MSLISAIQRLVGNIKARLVLPLNAEHQLLVRADQETWSATPFIPAVVLVDNDDELDSLKGLRESFAEVFANWQRISRQSGFGYSDNAYPGELDTWSYDAVDDKIICTINTTSHVGFISPQRFERYALEVVLRSTSSDDDYIGLAIAYARNPDTGNTEVLAVYRALTGAAPMYIQKNFGQADAEGYTLANVMSGLTWADGTVATGGISNGSKAGWSSVPDGIRLMVERNGDLITIRTSQPNATEYFEPATTVIDLSSDPRLEVFRGPQRYGYMCFSQPASTWEVLERPGDYPPIVDTRDWSHWIYEEGVWVSHPEDYAAVRAIYQVDYSGVVLSPHNNTYYRVGATTFEVI